MKSAREAAVPQVSLGVSRLVVRKTCTVVRLSVHRLDTLPTPLTVTLATKDASARYGLDDDHGGLRLVSEIGGAEAKAVGDDADEEKKKMGRPTAAMLGARSLALTFAPGESTRQVQLQIFAKRGYRGLVRFNVVLLAAKSQDAKSQDTLISPVGATRVGIMDCGTFPNDFFDQRSVAAVEATERAAADLVLSRLVRESRVVDKSRLGACIRIVHPLCDPPYDLPHAIAITCAVAGARVFESRIARHERRG